MLLNQKDIYAKTLLLFHNLIRNESWLMASLSFSSTSPAARSLVAFSRFLFFGVRNADREVPWVYSVRSIVNACFSISDLAPPRSPSHRCQIQHLSCRQLFRAKHLKFFFVVCSQWLGAPWICSVRLIEQRWLDVREGVSDRRCSGSSFPQFYPRKSTRTNGA